MSFSRVLSCTVLLVASLNLSCQKLSNALSETKLECGPDAESGRSYVQILDPRGQTLEKSQILVRKLNDQGVAEDVKATSKACVAIDDERDLFVVTSSKAEIPWGKVIRPSEVPQARQISMRDVSTAGLKVNCPNSPYLSHALANPVQSWADDAAFPYSMTLVQGDISIAALDELKLTGTMTLPGALNEGEFALHIHYQNLFKPDRAELHQTPKVCRYTLDRLAPVPQDSLAEAFSGETFKVQPGETITLSLDDSHADSLEYCLATDERGCTSEADFAQAGAEVSFQAPMSGRWCLTYKGRDKAGNPSETVTRCAISYQATVIENIRALADMALIRSSDDGLLATNLMLRAFKRYEQLPTPEEKAAVTDKILTSALTLGSAVKERNRQLLKAFVRRVEPLDRFLLVYDVEGLKLFDPVELTELQSLSVTDPISLSVQGNRLLVGTLEGFVHYVLQGDRLVELGRMVWPTGFPSQGTLELHPIKDEVLHFGSSGAVSVLRPSAGSYNFATSFQAVPSNRIVWSSEGDKALVQGQNDLAVIRRSSEGIYSYDDAQDYLENTPQGASYLAVLDGFVIATSRGIMLWRTDTGFSSVEDSVLTAASQAISSSSFTDRLLAVSPSQILFASPQGLFEMEFGGTAPKIEKLALPAFIQPQTIGSWLYRDGRLSILSGNNLAVLHKRAPENLWLVEQKIPGTSLKRIGSAHFQDRGRTVTIDRDLRLVSWASQSAFGSFVAENKDVIFLRFLKEESGTRLATAGNLAQARLWNLDGSDAGVFQHGVGITQINELSWNTEKTRFATGGEDGRIVTYDRAGQVLEQFDDRAVCGPEAFLRYTTVFASDGSTLVSAGSSAINVWTGSEIFNPLPQCPTLGPRPSVSYRTVPGDLTLIPWAGREVIQSAPSFEADERLLKYFELDGSPSPLGRAMPQEFSAVAFDHKHKYFARAGKVGGLTLYELTADGFQLVSEISGETLPFKAAKIAWSPDDRFLAVFYPQRKLMVFELSEAQLVERGERVLANEGTNKHYHPHWIDGDLAYFDKGVLNVLTMKLELRGKVSAFSETSGLTAADYDADAKLFAVQKDGEVKLLPFQLGAVHARLCSVFAGYFKYSSDFVNSDEWMESDRENCSHP